jgi:hypothetical protein
MRTKLTALLVPALLLGAASAAPTPAPAVKKLTGDEWKTATTAVDNWLKDKRAAYGQVLPISDALPGKTPIDEERRKAAAPVVRALPDHAFFFLIYRQFPVGRIPPPGLRSANVLAWGRDGKVVALTSEKELEKFVRDKLPPRAGDDQLKDAARAWLSLSQLLRQDGFFGFTLVDEDTKVAKTAEGKEASARVIVTRGGNGSIAARLRFNPAGKLVAVSEDVKLRSGPRPICHATLLLSPDPAVRQMAEDGLLVMGRACKPYLDEQRAKAPPELRRAIDRVWRRIVEQEQ